MKNRIHLLVLMSTFVIYSCAASTAEESVPQKVKEAFTQKFPEAKRVDWEQEGLVWEAEFKFQKKDYSASFDSLGKWLETEYSMKKKDLPADIKSKLDSLWNEYDIESVDYITTPEYEGYEVEVEIEDTTYEVLIDLNKGIVKKELVKDDDED